MANTFQDRLKEALELRGLKAADLSRLTGIAKSRISQYLMGMFAPKSDSLKLLARALNVSEGWLMGYNISIDPLGPEHDNNYLVEVKTYLTNEASELLRYFSRLNYDGQKKVLEFAFDISEIERYTFKKSKRSELKDA